MLTCCVTQVSAMWTFGAKTEDAVVATVLQRGTPNDHRKQVGSHSQICCATTAMSIIITHLPPQRARHVNLGYVMYDTQLAW